VRRGEIETERAREREREREIERERRREGEKEKDRQREKKREQGPDRQRQRERERDFVLKFDCLRGVGRGEDSRGWGGWAKMTCQISSAWPSLLSATLCV